MKFSIMNIGAIDSATVDIDGITIIEDTFPGNAIPRVKKSNRGSEKIRHFTIFSSQDFGELVNSGFFDHWNWGPYLSNIEDSSAVT